MSLALPSADDLTCDPAYPHLKEHVVSTTGLAYYDDKDTDLARRIGRRLSLLGLPDCASYFEVLRDPLRGSEELDLLIAEITIGETYFFRHQEHFDALRDVVVPDVVERKRALRSMRIWSAGCADGPEPYSLAIMLKREMDHWLMGWAVTILGTDINQHFLTRAREGKFDAWALRSTSEEIRNTCFLQQGKCWTIAPQYRENVSFQYHNLAEHSSPSLVSDLMAFDLIICRNVMIYFSQEQMRQTIRQFYSSLAPGGWLLVGPTEPNMTFFTSFRTINAPGVTLYQKPCQDLSTLRTEEFEIPAMPRLPIPIPAQTDPTLADVLRYANCGDWEQADRCCRRLLETENLNSAVHFYHSLVLEQMGQYQESEKSVRRAIYLDRKSVLAHYYLGLFLQSRGDSRQAARSFENSLELLFQREDGEVFADADGLTVAEMKKLVRMHLEILRERA